MSLSLVAALALASTLHAHPERAVARAVPEAQPYTQLVTSAAAGLDAAMVLWFDGDGSLRQLRAIRVDRRGRTLEPQPLIVSAGDDPHSPEVVRTLDRWIVTWASSAGIRMRTVRDDGTMTEPMLLADDGATGVRIATRGSDVLVVWDAGRPQNTVTLRAAGLDARGNVTEAARDVAAYAGPLTLGPLLATEDGYALLVDAYPGIDTIRTNPTGQVNERKTLVPGEEAYSVRAALDGDRLVAGWTTTRNGARVVREGEAPQTIAPADSSIHDLVTFRGRVYVLIESAGDLTLRAIDGDESRTWDVDGETWTAQVVAFPEGLLVAASVGSEGRIDVHTTVVDASLQDVAPPALIYEEPRLQRKPAIARAADGAMAVWSEPREEEGRSVVMGALLGSSGGTGGEPFALGENHPIWNEVEITSNGTDYLVTWLDPAEVVHARQVRSDGSVPAAAIPIGKTWHSSCATWTGSAYAIGTIHFLSAAGWTIRAEARLQTLRADGSLSDPIVVAPADDVRDIACAAGRQSTLVTWNHLFGHVRGALVTHGSSVGSAIHIGTGTAAAVASNGDNFLVAWLTREGNVGRARVTPGGTVELPFVPSIPAGPVSMTDTNGVTVSATPDGNYLLAWGTSDLFALLLAANGDVTGPPLDVSTEPFADRYPRLSGNLLVYERETMLPAAGRWRVFTRTLSDAPRRRRAVR
jgi:hypothetical protein